MRRRTYHKGDRFRLVGPGWPEGMRGHIFPVTWAPRHDRYAWIEGGWVIADGDHQFEAVRVDRER